MKKRVVSWLLVVLMLTSLLPTSVLAEMAEGAAQAPAAEEVLPETPEVPESPEEPEEPEQPVTPETPEEPENTEDAGQETGPLAAVQNAAVAVQAGVEPTKVDGVYQIGSGEALAWFRDQVNKGTGANYNAVLTDDIDLNNEEWTPIGKNNSYAYKGIFDGQGHTIKNLQVRGSDSGCYGFFGVVREGTVKNLTVEGSVIVTGNGSASSGVGGIVGWFLGTKGTIENCWNKAEINGSQNVGGIVGYVTDGYSSATKSIIGCINTANIKSNSNNAGGIVGYTTGQVTVSNCYNRGGCTSGYYRAGGIAGGLSSGSAKVTSCYTTGETKVANGSGKCAVVGQVFSGSTDKKTCFYLSGLTADSNATAVTEAELKAVPVGLGDAFLKAPAGMNDGYPILKWQVPTYAVTFTVDPAEAVVAIDGQTGIKNEDGTWTFNLPNGEYSYTVSAFGYTAKTGTVEVSDAGSAESVILTPVEKRTVTFTVTPETVGATITVTWNGQTVTAESAGRYLLPDGDYSYAVKAKGYATVKGDLTVSGDDATVSVSMTPSTAWDGEEKEEPSKENGVYQIGSGAELAWFSSEINAGKAYSAVLTDDIDLGGKAWTPIGTANNPFTGNFDGKGHTVSGLNVSAQYAGLFGVIKDATITGVVVRGTVTSTSSGSGDAGGIAGRAIGTKNSITDCGNEAAVSGGANCGGILGNSQSSTTTTTITRCYNTGKIESTDRAAGIMARYNNSNPSISDCYNAGSITSKYAAGIFGGGSTKVSNCYNVGAVEGADLTKTGAMTTSRYNALPDCYYLESSIPDGALTNGATAISNADGLLEKLGTDKWKTVRGANNGYPVLKWQDVSGAGDADAKLAADAHFQRETYTDDDTGEIASRAIGVLEWTPIANVNSYTVSLWEAAKTWNALSGADRAAYDEATDPEEKLWLIDDAKFVERAQQDAALRTELARLDVAITAASDPLDADVLAELYAERAAFVVRNIQEDEIGYYDLVLRHAADITGVPGTASGEGTLTYDLSARFAAMEEGWYYVTAAAETTGQPVYVPLDKAEDVMGVQQPYDRMKAVTGVRWQQKDGKAVPTAEWDGRSMTSGQKYQLDLYTVDGESRTLFKTFYISGSSTSQDLSRVVAAGKTYDFTITVLADADTMHQTLADSLPSAHSDAASFDDPTASMTWEAITSAKQWLEISTVEDEPSGGTGSASKQQVAWSKNYYLAADIDFSTLSAADAAKTKSIGTKTYPFSGTFSGKDIYTGKQHVIKGLTLSNNDSGLFWYTDATAHIQDVVIDSANVLFSDNAAVLVHNNYGTVERCAVLNTNITADTGAVLGGMISRNYGIIRDSYVRGGTLTSNSNTATGHGGFVGSNEAGGLIERCWTSMDISTRSEYAGGFVGLGYGGTIRDCFALGNVSARGYSGGFIGRYVYGGNVTENCYAAGVVTVTGEEGNGFNGGNKPDSSFQYEQTQGTANCWYNSANGSAGNYGAEAKSLDEMAAEGFLTALDKTGAWTRDENKNGGMPYLDGVDAPETTETKDLTVEIAIVTYDRSSYAFTQMGETISVTMRGSGNTRLVDLMDAAQAQNLLTYAYATTSTFGRFIHTINGYAVDAPDGWMFTINDELSNVSASLATVKDGDKVLWFEGTTENLFRGPKWDELGDDKLEWETISTVDELVALAKATDPETLGKNYRLTADLDLSEADFNGVGSAAAPFTGRFDGQGHTISHVTVSGTDGVGFFNVIKGATIKNLTLTDVNITGKTKVGGLVGEAQAVLGKNDPSENVANLIGACTVSGSVTGESAVGGLVGLNDGKYDDKTLFSVASAVNNCHAGVTVTGTGSGSDANNKLGGLVGDNSGVVTASSASGSVTGGKMAGGLAGSNSGSIYDSHAAGNVSGETNVGGFVGSSTGTVKNCYSTGGVTGTDYTGSFAGSISSAETAVGAGQVTVNGTGGYVGGFAGNLGGTLTGLASQITVKNVYGTCIQPEGKTLSAVGNTNAFTTDGQKAALAEMQLTDWNEVNDKLLELFGVSLPGIGEALAQFTDTAIPYGAKQRESFKLYTGEVTGEVTVTVAENAYIQAGSDKGTVALKTAHNKADGAAVAVTVTLRENGRTVSKTVTVTLLRQTEAVMHAIAATLTETKDDWTAMDMAAYAALGSGSSKLTNAARQNVIDLLIKEANTAEATASDRSRIELVLRALGVDTTRLYPINSNTPVDNAAKLRAMVDSISEYDYYTAPYVLLANMQGNVKLTAAQVDKLVRIMANNLGEGDIYTWSYNGQSGVDYDTTATALAAVQPYVGSNAAAKALSDRLLAALKKGIQPGTNANSDAMIIIGLVAAGVDPETVKCADGSSIVTDLLRYVNSTGDGFLYGGAENALATEQGFRALVALEKFKTTGKAFNVYDFSAVKTQPAHAAGTGEAEKPKDPEETEDKITVTVTISTPSGTWLSKSVELNKGSTVYHAFIKALEGSGVTQVGAENGYVRSISKGGVTYGEFTSGPNSGWLYKVNGVLPSVPLTQKAVNNGDYVLWYYTTDWKSDPDAGKMAEEELTAADVIKLIDAIGTVTKNSGNAIAAARSAYNKLSDAEKALVTNYDKLLAAEAAYAELVKAQQEETKTESVTGWQKQYKDALDEVKSGELTFGSEWLVIALARSGREVPDSYYDSVVKAVQDAGGVLSDKKFTEYSRTILALTAIGKDPTNVGGYDLLAKLADMDDVTYQGLNGAIFALLALDSNKYDVPAAAEGGKQVTRDGLVAYILEQQLADGGWALSGKNADPDMTAMALQALAAYRTGDTAVQTAVDKALKTLSDMQQADGGYSSWGTLNSESCAQVIIALTALGIDPAKDSRFTKNGLTVLDALLAFALDGGFRHTADGKADAMATEQALCALTAYARLLDGKTALYDMTDVLGGQTAEEPVDDSTPGETPKKGVGVVVWIVLGVAAVGGCTALAVTRRRRDE